MLGLPGLEVFVFGEAGLSEVIMSTIQLSTERKGAEKLSDGELRSDMQVEIIRRHHGNRITN